MSRDLRIESAGRIVPGVTIEPSPRHPFHEVRRQAPPPFRKALAPLVEQRPKFKLTAHKIREAIKRRDHGDETLEDIGRSYNVSHSTISRLRAG